VAGSDTTAAAGRRLSGWDPPGARQIMLARAASALRLLEVARLSYGTCPVHYLSVSSDPRGATRSSALPSASMPLPNSSSVQPQQAPGGPTHVARRPTRPTGRSFPSGANLTATGAVAIAPAFAALKPRGNVDVPVSRRLCPAPRAGRKGARSRRRRATRCRRARPLFTMSPAESNVWLASVRQGVKSSPTHNDRGRIDAILPRAPSRR
jgi:hypothetical protein